MATRQDASTGKLVQQPAATPKVDKKGMPELRRDQAGKPVMKIKVYSPYTTYYDEDGYSITAENATGPFDVLPRHYNFLTILTPCILVVHGPRGEKKIKISRGVMHVKADSVVVFLDV